jgi:hypothetical protein
VAEVNSTKLFRQIASLERRVSRFYEVVPMIRKSTPIVETEH